MRTFVSEEGGVDQGGDPSAQRFVLFQGLCIEDLEPGFETRITNQNSRILLIAFWVIQEPTFVHTRICGVETRIQALDNVPGQAIVDPRAIIFAKDDPGLTLRIPDDVLSTVPGAGDEVPSGMWWTFERVA